MQKSIIVSFKTLENSEVAIPILYERDDTDDIQTIRCKVNMPLGGVPHWLRPLKFEVRAMYNGKTYEPLINETAGVTNTNAAMFMEETHAQVLLNEKRATGKRK